MRASRRRRTNDAGFTVIECVIALSLVFVVLVILLGALTTGTRGLVTGRQRSTALAQANVVMEDARSRAYADVGHDLDSDPTLATDPLITGSAPNLLYTGVTPPEPLAGSDVDAGSAAGTNTNPLFPFSPHISVQTVEGTRYTTTVYVTMVAPASGDPYKRLTVKVSWTPAQSTAARSVSLSSYLFNAAPPPDPRLTGWGEASAGSFTVCASLDDCSNPTPYQLHVNLPYTSGQVDSAFVKTANGTANLGSARLDVSPGAQPLCAPLYVSATCDGAKADASADDDGGTPQPETDPETAGPAAAMSLTASGITATLGSGTATALATGRSCWACTNPANTVGDNDMLPYFFGQATGLSGGLGISFPNNTLAGLATGSGTYLSAGTTGCAASPYPAPTTQPCGAAVQIDRDQSAAGASLTSTATVSYPPISLLTIPTLISQGLVKIPATSITATATATAGSPSASATGSSFNVQVWNGLSYTNVPITPGNVQSWTGSSFSVVSGLVTLQLQATIHSDAKTTSAAGPDSTGLSQSSAATGSWLVVDVHVQASSSLLGVTPVDFWLHLDLGRVAATASYQAYLG
jgi:type II secretory pathway pseudopilin PulG